MLTKDDVLHSVVVRETADGSWLVVISEGLWSRKHTFDDAMLSARAALAYLAENYPDDAHFQHILVATGETGDDYHVA